jgi:uridine kinase
MAIHLSSPRSTVQARLPDGRIVEAPPGTTLGAILRAAGEPAVGAVFNRRLTELTRALEFDAEVIPLSAESADGQRIYRRSAVLLLCAAVARLFPGLDVLVEHAVAHGRGYFCEAIGRPTFRRDELDQIAAEMRALIAADLPFERRTMARDEATALFADRGQHDTARLIASRNRTEVVVYSLGGRIDWAHGYVTPSAGYINAFALHAQDHGFVLELPSPGHTGPPELEPYPLLFDVFEQTNDWLERLGLRDVGLLNQAVDQGRLTEIALVAEALHESRFANLARAIVNAGARVVLIAGPSASGKTTSSKRLAVQLLAAGKRPFPIGLDDYFFNRDATPAGSDGKPDFEALTAVDLNLFNDQLRQLLAGQRVELPHYNFVRGMRETGPEVQLRAEDVIVIEGIHGLNPALVADLPREAVYRVYVSALAGLNLDRHNRIQTTDLRLLRRIARDASSRGYDARATLSRWPSVTAGERRNIFPYQTNCDAIFNTCLAYELAVLRPLAEPLLLQVRPDTPEYVEANRLLSLLGWVRPAASDPVPGNSILREFIGGSSLIRFSLWP